ncbi:hypothetical protein HSRCO_2845 [Halanaeroarchaeum sp. HSR-CO]|nr:hypothetical protein HSRCO_2845 [Halanaeroarchaeum sp. HSR-CO]
MLGGGPASERGENHLEAKHSPIDEWSGVFLAVMSTTPVSVISDIRGDRLGSVSIPV